MSRVEEKVKIVCRFCGGTGKRYESEFFGGHHMPHTVRCHQCDGTGTYYAVEDAK